MGFRRAKSTQGNTNCQKNIFEDDQVPGHHPRALTIQSRQDTHTPKLNYAIIKEAQWPIGYGVGLRIKRSWVRIRPWPLR